MSHIELQILCKILGSPECYRTYLDNNVDRTYFLDYQEEWDFIYDFYSQYRQVPSIATFMTEFVDFTYMPINDPDKYLIESLKEEYLYNEGKRLFIRSVDKLEKNAYEGLEYILSKGQELLKANEYTEGTNLRNLSKNKLHDIEERSKSKNGMIGIPSGFEELDARLFGWQNKEELVAILARTNQGKSWIMQKMLAHANSLGKRVLLYSGEMSAEQVGFRYDTMRWNYSNSGFMKGDMSERDFTEYVKDLERYEQTGTDYIVIEPKDIGYKPLTVSKLKVLIEKFKPDIVGIDQLSFMEDERRTNSSSKREQYGNITIDLFNTSTEFNVPILLAVQANRDSAKGGTMTVPGLTDIGESDLVGQNASRVISFVQVEPGVIEMQVPKNRYGAKDFSIFYEWDIDLGKFKHKPEMEMEGLKEGLQIKNRRKPKEETEEENKNPHNF